MHLARLKARMQTQKHYYTDSIKVEFKVKNLDLITVKLKARFAKVSA